MNIYGLVLHGNCPPQSSITSCLVSCKNMLWTMDECECMARLRKTEFLPGQTSFVRDASQQQLFPLLRISMTLGHMPISNTLICTKNVYSLHYTVIAQCTVVQLHQDAVTTVKPLMCAYRSSVQQEYGIV